jgi:hypothetical protein
MRYSLAVWLARVIDEPGVVASDARVDHGVFIHSEQQDVRVLCRAAFIASIGLSHRNPFA